MDWKRIGAGQVRAERDPENRSLFHVVVQLEPEPPEGWYTHVSFLTGRLTDMLPPINFDGHVLSFVTTADRAAEVVGIAKEMIKKGNEYFEREAMPRLQREADEEARAQAELDALNEKLNKL